MESKRLLLRPVMTEDYHKLYAMAAEPDSGWRWNGLPPGPENFQSSLWNNISDQRTIVSKRDGEIVGLASAYALNLQHGHCYIQALLVEGHRAIGWPLEAIVVFIDHIFRSFNIRKIYGETSEKRFENFRSSVTFGAREEARLKDHLYHMGEYQDAIILGVTREAFYKNAERILRVVKP